jgi:hypothetical protein
MSTTITPIVTIISTRVKARRMGGAVGMAGRGLPL